MNLRGMDVILQALVVLTVALGIAIVFVSEKERWAIMDFCHFISGDAINWNLRFAH